MASTTQPSAPVTPVKRAGGAQGRLVNTQLDGDVENASTFSATPENGKFAAVFPELADCVDSGDITSPDSSPVRPHRGPLFTITSPTQSLVLGPAQAAPSSNVAQDVFTSYPVRGPVFYPPGLSYQALKVPPQLRQHYVKPASNVGSHSMDHVLAWTQNVLQSSKSDDEVAQDEDESSQDTQDEGAHPRGTESRASTFAPAMETRAASPTIRFRGHGLWASSLLKAINSPSVLRARVAVDEEQSDEDQVPSSDDEIVYTPRDVEADFQTFAGDVDEILGVSDEPGSGASRGRVEDEVSESDFGSNADCSGYEASSEADESDMDSASFAV
ncbi:hypothetical protein BD626DRAFT_477254 [Schizophyllum amplum]|uniref:Uncharacterized protein n=1 Tax=Schizophyllum amplum TaxID=97359 RepID=A0A550D029_9AGAR|nr:hypothetical protein BD626DRAFT_477254 [Auriculariopsis ampla]